MKQSIITARRYHDISCGHRVVGHENKCRGLHGHNYRITFECMAPGLDQVGRVIDFGVMKSKLCMWVEDNWDHKMLLWSTDPVNVLLQRAASNVEFDKDVEIAVLLQSLKLVPFNPTAENMALHLLNAIGPQQLEGTGVKLIMVHVQETMKCSATARLSEI